MAGLSRLKVAVGWSAYREGKQFAKHVGNLNNIIYKHGGVLRIGNSRLTHVYLLKGKE